MVLKFYVSCLILLLITSLNGYSQSYGLGFAGHEVVQDKRTALDLSVEKPLCFDRNFALTFDLSFMPGYTDYFGYIFRIIDQDKRNIDLVYDMRFVENKHFKLVRGNQVTNITFDIGINRLYKNWYKLVLNFDVEHQELVMVVDGKSYRQKTDLKKGCYKILFGANNYKDFGIKDVPPMRLKDIRINEGNHTSFYWPLAEKTGSKAAESVKNKDAAVANPIWIKKMHRDWQLLRSLNVKGAASVALNPLKEELYIVAEDSLLTYDIVSHQLSYTRYNSGKHSLLAGNQSIFDDGINKLINFYIDQKLVTSFNFSNGNWDKKYISPDVITNYWHPNKFYCPIDSSLYMIGGYGQYTYRKSIERFHFPDQKWTSVNAAGEFTPRYLSALGKVKNGAYILGGYGSSTGQQILNPSNIYDLNFYDVKSKTFRKLFELTPKSEEFAFANSMIVNEKTGVYHALTFPNSKYNSSLQMIEGSIHSPAYKLVGSSIPYAFHDIHSFADLFYCPSSKKYVAVVLFHDDKSNQTSVKIYTLFGPPEAQQANITGTAALETGKYLLYIIIPILLLSALLFFRRKRKRTVSSAIQGNNELEMPYEAQHIERLNPIGSESEKL